MDKADVLTKLLYRAETWTVYSNQARKLNPPTLTPGITSHLITCNFHHRLHLQYHHHHQRWGLSPKLSSMRPHIHLRIGLVGHLRIHRTETGEPVPGAPHHQRWGISPKLYSMRPHIHLTQLVGHLRIHHTETGEPVAGETTHSRDRHLHRLRTFTHRMGVFGHMRIQDSGIHRNADNTDTQCIPSAPALLTATATPTTMNDIPPVSTDFSCPHCARNFNSRIGLVGHLRIYRTEAGLPRTVHRDNEAATAIAPTLTI
ncbi:unnamed protein product [Schistocephalus solidus]|uniref:C2H2-type domain-containing protein n=1 Tax=Schistocephalus solidus TaxID=70667 RepID=A0A183SF45_SCHSO|nr:unnamed protein product [Schistocephalus solidus]